MAKKQIPLSDHLLRHCPVSVISKRDETGKPIYVAPTAFMPSTKDNGSISVNWLEYFPEPEINQLIMNLSSMRNRRTVPSSTALAKCNIAKLKQLCHNLGVIADAKHTPARARSGQEANMAHTSFGILPAEKMALYLKLAEHGVDELIHVKLIEAAMSTHEEPQAAEAVQPAAAREPTTNN